MIKRNTTVNKIAKFIRKEITYSNMKSGQHLKELEISKKFNISRVPVREAFRILQSEGYIEVIANRGIFVKAITKEHILETALCYKLLTPVLLEKAIPMYNIQTYKKADDVLKKIETCSDFNKAGYLLWDFAKIIYGPSKLKFLLSLIDDIYLAGIRSLNEIFEIKQRKHYDTSSHKKFLELCRQNKKKEAIKLWMNYVNKVEKISLKDKKM